jgi:UDPglucose 6-dehydrogenase
MNVAIVGSGYVGLVTGACLAEKGHRVVCIDIDAAKVEAINAGQCPIFEQGLPEIIARHAGRTLTATTDLARAVRDSELTLIAAPTPFDGERIDLTYVRQIAREIGAALRGHPAYHVVVVKSTVVPRTTDDVVGPLVAEASGKLPGRDFGLGMNPEFLSEGVAVPDFMEPDRIVLGGIDERTHQVMAELYRDFPGVPVLRTTNATAEMIKYASNALQATMISFANEIANVCESVGEVDAIDVFKGVHAMKELTVATPGGERVRAPITSFLLPGCGFGGSCFPKDLKAITAHGRTSGAAVPLLESVIAVNAHRPARMVDAAEQELGGLRGRRVAVLGLAFKPGTDDMRESPAIPVVRELQRRGAQVAAFDPVAGHEARKAFREQPPELAASVDAALAGAEAILLVTRWPEFADLPQRIAGRQPAPLVVDGRRMLDPRSVARYRGVGLASPRPGP